MPSSTLLPTPEPANRPMRWPRPTVSMALMARTPDVQHVSIGARVSGIGGADVERRRCAVLQRAEAVERAAGAVQHAAQQVGADRQVARAVARAAARMRHAPGAAAA